MAIVYDPTGLLIGNKLVDELHAVTTEAAIFPVENPYYEGSLVVTGELVSSPGSWATLIRGMDFQDGPSYVTLNAATGKSVGTFFTLSDMTKWSNIKITYQAVGTVVDSVLMTEIANLGAFDRTDTTIWHGLVGELVSFRAAALEGNYFNKTPIEIVSIQLQRMIDLVTLQNINDPNYNGPLGPYITGNINSAINVTGGTAVLTGLGNLDQFTKFEVATTVVGDPVITSSTTDTNTQATLTYNTGANTGVFTVLAYNAGRSHFGTLTITVA